MQYETPDEEDELLNEALVTSQKAVRRLDNHASTQQNQYSRAYPGQVPHSMRHGAVTQSQQLPYLTPNPSGNRKGVTYGHTDYLSATKPVDIVKSKNSLNDLVSKWPTPPSDSEWAASAAASIFAAGAAYR